MFWHPLVLDEFHKSLIESFLGQLAPNLPECRFPANQLDAFEAASIFQRAPRTRPSALPSWHDWNSQSGTLSERARAYLDVNCSTCHTPPGYTKLDLRWKTPLAQTQTINRKPEKPRVGPADSRLIIPGDPNRSELYLRMLHQGAGRMPNIASSEIHDDALKAIRAWINALDGE